MMFRRPLNHFFFLKKWIFVAMNLYQFRSLFFHVHVRFHFKAPLEFYAKLCLNYNVVRKTMPFTNKHFFFAFQAFICSWVSSIPCERLDCRVC